MLVLLALLVVILLLAMDIRIRMAGNNQGPPNNQQSVPNSQPVNQGGQTQGNAKADALSIMHTDLPADLTTVPPAKQDSPPPLSD